MPHKRKPEAKERRAQRGQQRRLDAQWDRQIEEIQELEKQHGKINVIEVKEEEKETPPRKKEKQAKRLDEVKEEFIESINLAKKASATVSETVRQKLEDLIDEDLP